MRTHGRASASSSSRSPWRKSNPGSMTGKWNMCPTTAHACAWDRGRGRVCSPGSFALMSLSPSSAPPRSSTPSHALPHVSWQLPLSLLRKSITMPQPHSPEFLTVADAHAWRQWLDQNEESNDGVWLTIAKKGTTVPTSLTYAEALDEAHCTGCRKEVFVVEQHVEVPNPDADRHFPQCGGAGSPDRTPHRASRGRCTQPEQVLRQREPVLTATQSA